jgi:glycosyltransferase involved in cell wall biosynthesis
MKIFHLLSTSHISGAEKIAIQIIVNEKFHESIYVSLSNFPDGVSFKFIKLIKFDFFNLLSLKKLNPNILHCHDVKASILGCLTRGKSKVISHIHSNSINMRKISIKSVLFLLTYPFTYKYIWVSKVAFEDFIFKNLFSKKSTIIQNQIDSTLLYSKVKIDPNNYTSDLLFLGRMSEVKNPLRAIKIMEKVIKLRPTTNCYIVGDGNLTDLVRNYISNSNFKSNIIFLGYQSNPYKLLSQSKILLMTSISEGTPLVVLEAQALGIPIITTPSGENQKLVINNFNGYISETDEEITFLVIKLLNDVSVHKSFSVNAKKLFNKMNSLESYSHQIGSIYEELGKSIS